MFTAVEIEINHNCNQNCTYCPNSKGSRKEQGYMSLEMYKRIMQQLQDIGFKGRISYEFYNEPMLHDELNNIIRLTKESLPESKVILYTNGTLLTQKKISELINNGIDNINVTKHEGATGYCFDEIYAKLPSEVKAKVQFLCIEEVYLTNRGGIMNEMGNEIPAMVPCFIPAHVVVITVKGNVLPCYEDYYQRNVMGNINRGHIKDIWDSQKYVDFRDSLKKCKRYKYSTCENCNRISRDVRNDYML